MHVELQYLYKLDFWCNGSTNDFGSFSIGSSPVESTNHLHLKINNMKRQPKVLSKNSDYKLVLDSCVYCKDIMLVIAQN